jgi:hypothetical protein
MIKWRKSGDRNVAQRVVSESNESKQGLLTWADARTPW